MKILNSNYKVVKVKSGNIVIPIIDPPKYYIGDLELTEYDVRNLQREVAFGRLSHTSANELNITDARGVVFDFREDGCLVNNVAGYNIIPDMTLDMIRNKRDKDKLAIK